MRRARDIVAVAVATAAVAGALLLGWLRSADEPRTADPPLRVATVAAPDAGALRGEALALYAAGQFPLACDRFSRAADGEPASAAWRQDVARCFEAWGWQTLRGGHAGEAGLLFRQGLLAVPDDPALLKALGIASIHAGRVREAIAPLERVTTAGTDPEVRLLLARLYDQQDDAERAVRHLHAVLEGDPANAAARRLLDKVERERDVEAGFARAVTPHFVLKHRRAHDEEAVAAVLRSLETARERVGAILDYRPTGHLTVVVYEDRQFRRVARVHGWVTGLFDGKIRLPLAAALPAPPALERLVAHEYAHAVIHELSRGRAPRWLHEGLAQALEGASVDPMLRVPGRLSLSGLEALVSDPDAVRARAGYDIALWVVSDLEQRGGVAALRLLLERLGAGDPLAAAMARVYGVRLADLESQWAALLGG